MENKFINKDNAITILQEVKKYVDSSVEGTREDLESNYPNITVGNALNANNATNANRATEATHAANANNATHANNADKATTSNEAYNITTTYADNVDHWNYRFTAGDNSVIDGEARLQALYGFTLKNHISNGDFRNGLEGWSIREGNETVTITDDIVIINSYGNYGGIKRTIPTVCGHYYFITCRVAKGDAKSFILDTTSPSPNKSATTNGWQKLSIIVCADSDNMTLNLCTGSDTYESSVNCVIDRHYGVSMYDLTEYHLGASSLTVSECEKYFPVYIDGMQSTKVNSIVSSGAQLYNYEDDTTNLEDTNIEIPVILLVKNGNFLNGLDSWTNASVIVDDYGDYISIIKRSESVLWCDIDVQPNHAYLFSVTLKNHLPGSMRIKVMTVPEDSRVTITAIGATSYNAIFQPIYYNKARIVIEGTGEMSINKNEGIMLIDLTAMGIDEYLPNGNSSSVYNITRYLGNGYFAYNTEYKPRLRYDEGYRIIQIPVLKSTRENRGYTIHGFNISSVCWSPLSYKNNGFDYVRNLETYSDVHSVHYDHNIEDGYLFIKAMSVSLVHANWSYAESDLFTKEWHDEYSKYWSSTTNIFPIKYIDDGEIKEITELNGVGDGDGGWFSDIIDFENKLYSKKVKTLVLNGEENWSVSTLDGHKVAFVQPPVDLFMENTIRCDKATYDYHCHYPNTFTFDADTIAFNIEGKANTVKEWKAYLANNPYKLLYCTTERTREYELVGDYSANYRVEDFGIERIDGTGPIPKVAVSYGTNYRDVIRNVALTSSNGNGLATLNDMTRVQSALDILTAKIFTGDMTLDFSSRGNTIQDVVMRNRTITGLVLRNVARLTMQADGEAAVVLYPAEGEEAEVGAVVDGLALEQAAGSCVTWAVDRLSEGEAACVGVKYVVNE